MDASEREKLIELIVEQVLRQLQQIDSLSISAARPTVSFNKRLITEQDVKALVAAGNQEVFIGPQSLITPLAQDTLRAHRIVVQRGLPPGSAPAAKDKTVALLAGDATSEFRRALAQILQSKGCCVQLIEDRLPSFAEREKKVRELAHRIAANELHSAVVLDGKVFCLNIAANRIERVRGAICWDVSSTRLARDGCGANILFVNDRLIDQSTIAEMVRVWIQD